MKKHFKHLSFALVALFAPALLAACSSAPSSAAQEALPLDVHYENSAQGFSMDVPSAWTNMLQDDTSTTYAYFQDPEFDDIAVVVQKSAYAEQFQSLSDEELIDFFVEESGGYMNTLSVADAVIDGHNARRMTYIMGGDGEEGSKRAEYVYDAGGQSIEITFFALEGRFADYEPTFDAILASFDIFD